jgi:nicotinate-nucleotide adenylyltransferase
MRTPVASRSGAERSERLGLLGGTFDPPHHGHLEAAAAVRDQLGLDRVLLVVANHPWQKTPLRTITPGSDRFAMVTAAVQGHEGIDASSLELERTGDSYTIDTVEELLTVGAGGAPPELFLIIGADLVSTLDTWERVDALRKLVTLVVVSRPGTAVSLPAGWHAVGVEGPAVDVSSSQVRSLVAQDAPLDDLVPDAVVHCIRQRDLYAVG